mgnify:CR=1 FL=1
MIRLGLIGCGYWGPNYLRNFSTFSDAQITAACDIDHAKLALLSNKYSGLQLTANMMEILEDPNIHGVIICTPATTHYKFALAALQHNKHVLVEKPLTTSSTEAKELIALATEKKKILMVGHVFMYNSAINQIKQYIDNGDLGKVLYAYASRTGLGPVRSDINVCWDLAPHDISILCYILNKKPLHVTARGEWYLKQGNEDVAFSTLEFEQNIIANLHISWLDPIKIRKLTLVGTKKMLVFNDVLPTEKIKIFDKGFTYERPLGDFGDFQVSLRDGDILIPKIKITEPLTEQCLDFIDCIKTNKKPKSDADHGLLVVQTLEAMHASLKNKNTTNIVYS